MGGLVSKLKASHISSSTDTPDYEYGFVTESLIADEIELDSNESFALCVGIGQQMNKIGINADLGPPADNDAKSLLEIFAQKHRIPTANQKLLICDGSTDTANKANVLKNLNKFSRNCTKDGVLIFTFSGHNWYNLKDKSSRPFLIPTDFDGTKNSAISSSDLRKCICKTKAKAVIFILDCCFSGKLGREFLSESKFRTSVYVLSSCLPNQRSISYRELGHGIFTYFLMKYFTTNENRQSFPLQAYLEYCHPLFRAMNRLQSPFLEADCLMTPEALSNVTVAKRVAELDSVDGGISVDHLLFIRKYIWQHLGRDEESWLVKSQIPMVAVSWIWSSNESLNILSSKSILTKKADDQKFYTTVVMNEIRSVCQLIYDDESSLKDVLYKVSSLSGVSWNIDGPMDDLILFLQKVSTDYSAIEAGEDSVDGSLTVPKDQVPIPHQWSFSLIVIMTNIRGICVVEKLMSCFNTIGMTCIKGQNANRVCSESVAHIYHEKQSKEMCALHALNNLYQDGKAFSKKELDTICYSLSPGSMINPHKSMFGFGNYDVNVLMSAVQLKESEAIWFDKRKDVSCLCLKNIHGFVLNIPTEYKWGIFTFPIHRKHWIAIRDIDGVYYNLDSKLDCPEAIGKPAELLAYLKEQLECQDKELLIIVSKEVEENGNWRCVDSAINADDGACEELLNQRIFKLTINTTMTADGKEEITGVLCDSLPENEKRKQSDASFLVNRNAETADDKKDNSL